MLDIKINQHKMPFKVSEIDKHIIMHNISYVCSATLHNEIGYISSYMKAGVHTHLRLKTKCRISVQ